MLEGAKMVLACPGHMITIMLERKPRSGVPCYGVVAGLSHETKTRASFLTRTTGMLQMRDDVITVTGLCACSQMVPIFPLDGNQP